MTNDDFKKHWSSIKTAVKEKYPDAFKDGKFYDNDDISQEEAEERIRQETGMTEEQYNQFLTGEVMARASTVG